MTSGLHAKRFRSRNYIVWFDSLLFLSYGGFL